MRLTERIKGKIRKWNEPQQKWLEQNPSRATALELFTTDAFKRLPEIQKYQLLESWIDNGTLAEQEATPLSLVLEEEAVMRAKDKVYDPFAQYKDSVLHKLAGYENKVMAEAASGAIAQLRVAPVEDKKNVLGKKTIIYGLAGVFSGLVPFAFANTNTTADVHLQLQLPDGYNQMGIIGGTVTDTATGQLAMVGVPNIDAGMIDFYKLNTPVKDRKPIQPDGYNLSPNFPNPFNPSTNIRFEVPNAANVDIDIYTSTGKFVKHLVNQNVGPGAYQVCWDGTNNEGNPVASGVYLYRMNAGNFTDTHKMAKIDGGGASGNASGLVRLGNALGKAAGVNDAGVVYRFKVWGDKIDSTSTVDRIVNDTTMVVPVQGKIPVNPWSFVVNEGDSNQVDLSQKVSPAFGVSSYRIDNPNGDLIVEVNGNYLKVKGKDGDVNGSFLSDLIVRDNHGSEKRVRFPTTINPQPDVSGVLYDPVLKKVVDGATVRIQGKNYTVVPSDSGLFKLQLVPGNATLTTDTTGGRMQTEWNLGSLGTGDVALDTIPVFYKNGNMELMVDVKSNYGPGDPNVYATNKIWNPNIQHEGLPRGTLKTIYVNYTTNIGSDATRQANLNWLIEKSKLSVDDKVRLQMPSDATVVDIPVSSAADEEKIGGDFLDGKIYSDYDFMVVISRYSGDTNMTNANLVQEYTTKAVANVSRGNLGPARAAGLSEVVTSLQNTEDPTPARDEMAKGTLYGKSLYFDNQNGYKQNVLYGPAGNQITTSSEELVGKISMNIPLNSRIEREKIILPVRQ